MSNHILPDMFNNKWTSINNGIQTILVDNNQHPRYADIIKIINSVSKMKNGNQQLYNRIRETISLHLKSKVLVDVLNSLNKNFLAILDKCWTNYKKSMILLKDMLMCMGKYLKSNNLEPIDNVGISLFLDIIIQHDRIKNYLRKRLLIMVIKYRKHKIIKYSALKNACQMLVELGLTDEHVYEEVFERPFLALSRKFYYNKSQILFKNHIHSYYIFIAKMNAIIEAKLAKHFLHISTKRRIIEVVNDELIKKHILTIIDIKRRGCIFSKGYRIINKALHINDIKCMFELFDDYIYGPRILSHFLKKYLVEQLKIVENKNKRQLNPVTYVQRLLDVNSKLNCLLCYSLYKNNEIFKKTIFSTFKHFINLHPKFPEYLSLFIDKNVQEKKCFGSEKNKKKTPILDQVVVLFKFLQDIYVFKKYYKQHLAKRLLSKCFNEDNEKNMISNLKTEFGDQFTSKFEGMVKDIAKSNTIMDLFKINLTASQSLNCTNIDLSVCVLTTEFWSLPTSSTKCNIPNIAYLPYEEFKTFYLSKNYGHKLQIQPQLGSAEIIFNKNYMNTRNVHKNLLEVSTYQMAILMLFNSFNKITMETIMKKTKINENDLTRELQLLVTGKLSQRILLKSPNIKEIKPHHEFCINELFSCLKIHLITTEEENKLELRKTKEMVEEDRKHEIQAVLVRIMKVHKKLTHNNLTMEVTDQLRRRFVPSPMLINKCIERLIENGYLRRSPKNRNTYIYVA
ncbi:Cullin homology,Winged helix-turn-helix DNA-binding domain,Cullin protein, neddylation domain,Cullin [Cinara cedri]|uniref:Cullin homology,Winged helix-turn-helix DNA-binding domain,Cullin protein, neddylation domain,Cullin n=1 Tax=Cinara cedri TaxID=506608 RepID=A0A5E4MY42_9HEMI|nr:Cullin homology,Winged helix-turn-helix DNA-binding domain,Cullin protein, neddylation domain,Cullin [Cinara cedri]